MRKIVWPKFFLDHESEVLIVVVFCELINDLGIDGLVVMKHIFGIKLHGTKIRIRKESKVLTLSLSAFLALSLSRSYVLLRLLIPSLYYIVHELVRQRFIGGASLLG